MVKRASAKARSQSAMEYLMTYGWAILIIAVVLGAIYSLGLFNGASLAPRTQPGACQVYRPNGPGTVQYISLGGSCANELPQYALLCNGQVFASMPTSFAKAANATISVWFNPSNPPGSGQYIFNTAGTSDRIYITESTGNLGVTMGSSANSIGTSQTNKNVWYNAVLVWAGTNAILFVNGQLVSSGAFSALGAVQNPMSMCGFGGDLQTFTGMVSNIQFYNSSFDANSVKALYLEGIGGAPINLQSLVSWWPLNGNMNDYSGNLNNGVPSNTIYTNQWLNGYIAP